MYIRNLCDIFRGCRNLPKSDQTMDDSEHFLNDKQQSFVLNCLQNGFDFQKAAIDAGYAPRYAANNITQLTRHPVISERLHKAIKVHQTEQFNKILMTMEERGKILQNIIYDIVPKNGEPKRQYYKQAISAIQELNKMSGDYAPDKRLRLNVDLTQEKLHEARKVYDEF